MYRVTSTHVFTALDYCSKAKGISFNLSINSGESGLFRGTTVLLSANNRSTIGVIILFDPNLPKGGLGMSPSCMETLEIGLGDVVTVENFHQQDNVTEITVAVYANAASDKPFSEIEDELKAHILHTYQASVHTGDIYYVENDIGDMKFKILECSPVSCGFIDRDNVKITLINDYLVEQRAKSARSVE